MKVKMSSWWDSLKGTLSSTAEKAKAAVGMESSPLVNGQEASAGLGLAPPATGQTVTGGKRYRKTRRHRGGKKRGKTGKRKH
jgi:hypothetical protein